MAPRPIVKVSVPDPETTPPRYGWLTLIVGACFVVGLVWPTLAGMKFVQRPPGSSAPKLEELEPPAPTPEPEPEPRPGPSPEPTPGPEQRAAAHLQPNSTAYEGVRLGESLVESCYDERSQALARCDKPNLGGVLEDLIAKLAGCEAAEGASGELSLGLELDFERGHITRAKAGQSTTLPRAKSAALLACARDMVVGTALERVAHEHRRYWLYYRVRFLPAASPLPGPKVKPADVVGASGQGTIAHKTALVREAPTRQAQIADHLLYGTRVNVTGRAGDWYRISYSGGNRVGWVHRTAIGM
jgi:SH3 domain-containing protein